MKARIARGLDELSVLLGVGVITLVGLNFTLRHDLATGSRIRFLASGALLALVALYFRLDVRKLDELRRAAYRVATTLMIWSLGYALLPYPQTFLYLVIFPALFFLFRLEVKARAQRERREDLVASGLLFALGAFLYFEQQPMQVILFSDAGFDWIDYYLSAPVMAVVGLGFLRLTKRGGWAGLSILGTVFLLLSLVLTSSLVTPVDELFEVPIEIFYVLVFVHLSLALLFVEHAAVRQLAGAVYDFAGLSGKELRRFRLQVYWLGNTVLHLAVPVVLMASWGRPLALVPAVAAVAGTLYHYRRSSVSVVLIETSLLAFPTCAIFYPEIPATALCVFLGLVLASIVLLRRSFRFADSGGAVPNPVYVVCVLIFLAGLVYRGFFVPSGLGFLLLLFLSWLALPDRPGKLPPRLYHWTWPPLTALLLLCLFRGYDPFLLPIWALSVIAPPVVAYAFLTRVDVVQRYGWIGVTGWLANAPRALSTLSFVALLICGTGFASDYGRYAEPWGAVLLVFAVLACNLGFHFAEAVRSSSTRHAAVAEVHLWLMLGLLRFKLEVMEALELGTPLDGYVLLGAAFVVAGLREVLRRPGVLGGRADVFSALLLRSMTVYGVLGWLYMLWLELYYGGGYHGETGSILMAALYYWFSLTRKKTHIIPAMVFVNVAVVLFFFRVGLFNPQFYVLPTAASVLVLAQVLKEELAPRRLAAIRLGCSLAVLCTSSFYNMVGFGDSLAYPLVAALVAALGVVVGISLRVRVYLFLGFSFFVLNTLAVLVHVILNQPPSHVKLAMGVVFLVIGVVFTGSFLLLQMKRQELLRQYTRWKEELSTWE